MEHVLIFFSQNLLEFVEFKALNDLRTIFDFVMTAVSKPQRVKLKVFAHKALQTLTYANIIRKRKYLFMSSEYL